MSPAERFTTSFDGEMYGIYDNDRRIGMAWRKEDAECIVAALSTTQRQSGAADARYKAALEGTRNILLPIVLSLSGQVDLSVRDTVQCALDKINMALYGPCPKLAQQPAGEVERLRAALEQTRDILDEKDDPGYASIKETIEQRYTRAIRAIGGIIREALDVTPPQEGSDARSR